MNRKDIVDCFENVKATEIQKQKMLNTILMTAQGEVIPIKRKTRFSAIPIAAVIVMLILSTGTVLAMTFGWHETLLSQFNPTPEQMELLDETVGAPNVMVTQNGVTITIIQTISDSFTVYVLYEITVEDETFEFPEETFVNARLFTSSDSGEGVTTGSSESIILENFGNRLLILQSFHSTAPTVSENVELLISSIKYHTEEWSYDGRIIGTIFEGWWRLRWELDFADTETTIFPDTVVSVEGGSSTITQIVISPLSVMIFFEGDIFTPDIYFVSIHKNDGTEIVYGADSENVMFTRVRIDGLPGIECDDPEGIFSATLLYSFDSIISVNDIDSITIGNITIHVDN
ncbi:MAG: DUF4179 domain-containing protein [Oscillospiraceae bacterium]|nr:DUF4179 domain-containing protein [Oscillospiraceae bacterium]